jgi:hypothetical protein
MVVGRGDWTVTFSAGSVWAEPVVALAGKVKVQAKSSQRQKVFRDSRRDLISSTFLFDTPQERYGISQSPLRHE